MRSEPIDHCIYCGADDKPLSDEHVIPYSLGGKMVLPKASCQSCSDITSQFELQISRYQLGPFRVRSDLPTRRPKERPKKLPLIVVDNDGTEREVKVDPDEHPGTLLLPDLPEPTLVLSTPESPRRKFSMFVAVPDSGVFRLPDIHKATAIGIGSFEIGAWYRLLAKIAHAGAFYYPGDWTKVWEPTLPDLILGIRVDFDQFVGGTGVQEFDKDDGIFPSFYRSVPVKDQMYLVAYFRMFSQNHTPTYQVVVGRRKKQVTEVILRHLDPDSLEALAFDPDRVTAALSELDLMRAKQLESGLPN